jgi:PGF-pre-PGF domain-containing protein
MIRKVIEKKRFENKKSFLILFLGLTLFFSILSISNISAYIVIVSPANSTNYSGNAVFNVSYINVTDGITNAVNATFYYNYSGVWTLIGTVPCSNNYNNNCNGTLNTSGLHDGRYTLNVTLNNGTTTLNMGAGGNVSTYNVTFDHTGPSVLNFNVKMTNGTFITTNRANLSGVTLYLFNVSVNDSWMNISSVYFNISYSNGTQINYTRAINVTLTNYTWMVNLTNVSSDAIIYIRAVANDTLNNINNTEIFQITLDDTTPTASFACSPTSVTSSGTVDCTCTPADNLAGIDSTLTSYISKPSVSTVGTFTLNCSFYDFAGNFGSTTATYTVTASGSGSITTSSNSQIDTIENFDTWTIINPGTPVTMQDFATASSVKQIELEVSSAANNVQLTVSESTSKPSGISVSQTDAYKYIQVDTLNLLTKLSKATMQIKVEKSWVSQQEIDKANVALFKFDEVAQRWNELTTTFNSEDATYYYYNVELNSFSYFVIAPKAVTSGEQNPVTTGTQTPTTTSNSWIWIIVTLIILAIIAVVFVVFGKKKRK